MYFFNSIVLYISPYFESLANYMNSGFVSDTYLCVFVNKSDFWDTNEINIRYFNTLL